MTKVLLEHRLAMVSDLTIPLPGLLVQLVVGC